jgi:hypothetical protein
MKKINMKNKKGMFFTILTIAIVTQIMFFIMKVKLEEITLAE